MKFVDVEEAKNASGVRLVVLANVPSPWSEAAKGLLRVKGIDAALVRFTATDQAVKAWTGFHNAPVLFVNSDPPKSHWSDILESVERVGGKNLIPSDPDERVKMFGLAHDLLGESGLVWSGRIVVVHRGIESNGSVGFSPRAAQYLAAKYTYAPEQVGAAKAHAIALLQRFGAMVERAHHEGRKYLLPSGLSALDVYLATALAPFAVPTAEQCPGMHPGARHAFESADAEMHEAVSDTLRAYRDFMYETHLGFPIEL